PRARPPAGEPTPPASWGAGKASLAVLLAGRAGHLRARSAACLTSWVGSGPAAPGAARSRPARGPRASLSDHPLRVTDRTQVHVAAPQRFPGSEVLVRARAPRIVAEAHPRT